MFVGRLDNLFESVMTDLMMNSISVFVVGKDVHCMVDSREYAATVTYMRKPLEKAFCGDRNHSLIIMQCVIIEIEGVKLPIFADGEIYLSISMNEAGITHPILIKSPVARQFFHFIVGIHRDKRYVQYDPTG